MRSHLFSLFVVFFVQFAHTADAARPIPAPPSLAARGYLLMDANSGAILAEKNSDQPLEPASITKLMTAYVLFHELASGRITLEDEVTVSETAWRMKGSRMFIEVGKRVKVADLLQGMIIQSGNDASVALAEYVAGTEDVFATMMNDYAVQLGMGSSHFLNSTGLPDEGHLTTARDIAVLAHAIIDEFPDYYRWYSQREFTYNNITQPNRNRLLHRDPSVDGMKTGHTEAAGYCLVASAKRNDMRLISVVLGSNSPRARTDASQSLLNHGFRNYETRLLYAAGDEIAQARVWKGAADKAPVALDRDLYVTIPRGQYSSLAAELDLQATLFAPLSTDQSVGRVRVNLDDELIAEANLYPLSDMALGGLWDRMIDEVMLWFE